jgi:hypothetical protein
MRRMLAPVLALLVVSSAACSVDATDDSSTESMEVDCRGVPCDWVTVQGNPRYGATWHDGDVGVDMSGNERDVVEQRVVMFPLHTRQLEMIASTVRDAEVSLHVQFDFYAPGQAQGETFWDRQPVFLVTRDVDVFELGVAKIHREVLIPSEAAAVVVRLVKEGDGRAMVDEFTLGHP